MRSISHVGTPRPSSLFYGSSVLAGQLACLPCTAKKTAHTDKFRIPNSNATIRVRSDRDAHLSRAQLFLHCSNSRLPKIRCVLLIGNARRRTHLVGRRAGGPREDKDRSMRRAAARKIGLRFRLNHNSVLGNAKSGR